MKAKGKLRQGLEDRVKTRVDKLKKRKGYYYFLSDINYPNAEKQRIKYELQKLTKEFETLLPEIKKIIKSIKSDHIPHIWDQTAITAVYILIGKAYSNLETILSLVKDGHNLEIIELARAGQESLDLAFLFLEDGQSERIESWFKGNIIDNKLAREAFHKILNSEVLNMSDTPVYDTKTDIYGVYSLYTHSSYAALLDAIDVFHEDFDFERISGLYYTHRYFDAIVKNLVVSMLLELKNVFTKYKNLSRIDEVDKLLEKVGNYKASPEEIKQIFEQYLKG